MTDKERFAKEYCPLNDGLVVRLNQIKQFHHPYANKHYQKKKKTQIKRLIKKSSQMEYGLFKLLLH